MRLEGRSRGLTDLPEPSWDDVSRAAEYEPWTEPVLRLDSALPVDANAEVVLRVLDGLDRR
ncbi:MAG: kinase [Pseudonocardia sp.]|jgi:hypothetical protein|nr:kinase [Pseudonocardia sp.]